MGKLNSNKIKEQDIVQIILKPFLMIGYVFMLGFGLVYYGVYVLINKFSVRENYFGNINGFIKSVKSIVFSDEIRKHRDLYHKKNNVKKSRKQSTEYVERPITRVYTGNRAQTRTEKTVDEKTEAVTLNAFKRIFAYAGIFFLKEEIRKEKKKEIDQKYPPKHRKEKVTPGYTNAVSAAASNQRVEYKAKTDLVKDEVSIVSPIWQKRIMIASVSIISMCALVFVGALAYAQELPAGLNFISPKPTADLFQTTVPILEQQVCEILLDSEESLYLEYSDSFGSSAEQSSDVTSAAVNTTSNDVQTETIVGNITTEPKIYKQDDEDPEVAKIQAQLMELHYMKSTEVTEYYGKNTTYAMEYFQRQHGLQVDGSAGAETLAVLYSDEAQEYKVAQGTEGADVKELQQRLYELRYFSSGSYITGYFGTKTESAIKDFQATNGLSADGIAGYYTYTKLFSSSAIKNSTSSGGSSGGSTVTGSGSAADIVAVAKSLRNQGYIYVWGGKDPSSGGFDCSGFVYYVLRQAGISTGYRDTDAWATTTSYTTIEKMEDVKPGDVLVFSSGHVAIYIGDGKMIHSTSKSDSDPGGIYIDSFFTDYRRRVWIWGKRIAN